MTGNLIMKLIMSIIIIIIETNLEHLEDRQVQENIIEIVTKSKSILKSKLVTTQFSKYLNR